MTVRLIVSERSLASLYFEPSQMNMMIKAKDEDADRDRFIEFLKTTEGTEFVTIAVDVPNKSRQKNFDYLLRESSAKTRALEIT
jgi:hypothetical protein